MTPPFSETWPSLTGGGLINPSLHSLVCCRRPSTHSFTLLNSLLAEGEADVCCCGFRRRLLSHPPGGPAPVGCCRYYRSAQPAPTHPGSPSPVFPPRAHSDYLWHSTVVAVPAAIPLQPGQYDCHREQAQLPLSPLASWPSCWFSPGSCDPLPLCVRRDGSTCIRSKSGGLLNLRGLRRYSFHHPLAGTPSAGRATVHQNYVAGNSSIVNS